MRLKEEYLTKPRSTNREAAQIQTQMKEYLEISRHLLT